MVAVGFFRSLWAGKGQFCSPSKRDAGNARETALAECKVQLHFLRQRVAKHKSSGRQELGALFCKAHAIGDRDGITRSSKERQIL